MSWDQEAREVVARVIAEEIDHLPFGEPGETCRAQARESYLRDAAAILDALAPVVAREVARAELRGAMSAPGVVAAVEVLALTTAHTAQSITDAAETVAKAMRDSEAGGSCTCECSPPEFGGKLPDRDCPFHGEAGGS